MASFALGTKAATPATAANDLRNNLRSIRTSLWTAWTKTCEALEPFAILQSSKAPQVPFEDRRISDLPHLAAVRCDPTHLIATYHLPVECAFDLNILMLQ
jgi:hypothetical protein